MLFSEHVNVNVTFIYYSTFPRPEPTKVLHSKMHKILVAHWYSKNNKIIRKNTVSSQYKSLEIFERKK